MKTINLKQWMIVFLSFAIFFSSCNDDDDNKITGAYVDGAFITNEGGFGAGNGSVSFYSYDNDTLVNGVFNTINNRVLGDVVQSITINDNVAYIVVNASNKVEVTQANSFIEKGVITDVVNPRYFVALDDDKGYVSQWGDNGAIKVIDLEALAVTKTITVGAGAEQMIIHNDMLYVANSGGYANNNTISIIDTKTDEVTKTITLDGDSPRDFVLDANNDIWVLCAGYTDWYSTPTTETPSKLIRITTTNNEIAQTIKISDSLHPTCLEVSKNRNNIFYGGGYGVQGIFKMSITDASVPTTALIDKSFYGFSINPETGVIFAMEAPSFSANGTMYRYEANGTELGSYEAGIGPNGAGFKKK
jgi:YVTN family beta-propeller protein